MARSEGPTKRTKHIDVKHYYLQQQVSTNVFRLQQISATDQKADFLTKPLNKFSSNVLANYLISPVARRGSCSTHEHLV
jgi:hypothetical protein